MWHLDLAFAGVVSTTGEPHLGAIQLAWWRERLEDLDRGQLAAEPRLRAVANELLSRGIKGDELSRLEDAWLPALAPFPWGLAQEDGFRLRGRILFGVGARLLQDDRIQADFAGELWSLIDAAVHCSDPVSREDLLAAAKSLDAGVKISRRLRPLTTIAAVLVADLRFPANGFARGLAAAVHRATGRFPKLP